MSSYFYVTTAWDGRGSDDEDVGGGKEWRGGAGGDEHKDRCVLEAWSAPHTIKPISEGRRRGKRSKNMKEKRNEGATDKG